MKIPEKSKVKKGKVKHKHIPRANKEHVLIVAQEIKFARLLSGNEKKTRDRVLKSLKKWLLNCFEKGYEFKEDDFVRVWKGLFYAVWMSDKPLIQEDLCENIAGILDIFPSDQVKYAILMTKAGFRVLATEWYGIDHHRMDKFLMLVRRYLRGSFRVLLRSDWSLKSCEMYSKMLSSTDGLFALKTPHYARNALSMQLHVVDCYLEELAKVSSGAIPGGSLVALLQPLCGYLCGGAAPALCTAARRLLTALLRQSAPGLRYQHATAAWKQMGCPEGGPEALELVSDDDAEDEAENDDEDMENGDEYAEKPLDPRAGRVDVELASLPVPAAGLAHMLRALLPTAASKAHKRVKICLERFEQLARDKYPLREREAAPGPARAQRDTAHAPREAAKALHALEKTLVASSDELALRGLSRKHRKRLLAKSRAGMNIVEELDKLTQAVSTNSANGEWQVEAEVPMAKKVKQDTSNKENRTSKKRTHDKTDADAPKKRKTRDDATRKRQKVAVEKSKKVDLKKKKSDKIVENGVKKVSKANISEKDSNVLAKVDSGCDLNSAKIETPSKDSKKSPKIHQKPIVTEVLKEKTKKTNNIKPKNDTKSTVLVNKVKHFQKQSKTLQNLDKKFDTPKKVKFVLKNNSMQGPVDYYKSVRQSPSIPFDGTKQPNKTNLKPGTPSPINPFLKKKLKLAKF